MPEEDGYDLIRKMRALPLDQGGSTPAVALTAFAALGGSPSRVPRGLPDARGQAGRAG